MLFEKLIVLDDYSQFSSVILAYIQFKIKFGGIQITQLLSHTTLLPRSVSLGIKTKWTTYCYIYISI